MKKSLIGGLAAVFLAAACSGGSEPASEAPVADTVNPSDALNALVEEFYDRNLVLNPLRATANGVHDYDDQWPNSLGQEHRDKVAAMHEEFRLVLNEVDALLPAAGKQLDESVLELKVFPQNVISDHRHQAFVHVLACKQLGFYRNRGNVLGGNDGR